MKVEVFHQVDSDWWNQLLRTSPHGNIFQTTCWGEYLQIYFGSDVFYIVCFDDRDNPVGLLVLARGIPHHSFLLNRPFSASLIHLLKKIKPVFSWTYGPVLIGVKELWEEILFNLFQSIFDLTKGARIGSSSLPFGIDKYVTEGIRQQLSVSKWGTFLVDLDMTEEELWKNLKPAARKSIRHAKETGISVGIVEGETGRKDFHNFLKNAIKRKGGRLFPVENLLVRYRLFKQINGEDIYIAKLREETIGSLGIWRFNGIIHEFGANQSQTSIEQKLYCGDLLKWEIMREESRRCIHLFDLSGVNPNPSSGKEKGIFQFKKKWGGEYMEYVIVSKG